MSNKSNWKVSLKNLINIQIVERKVERIMGIETKTQAHGFLRSNNASDLFFFL